MDMGWNFLREHLRPVQRSQYVVSDGGDQPNVVPPSASVWYFIREMDAEHMRENFDRAVQEQVGGEPEGLATELRELGAPPENPRSGGSDDIGDIPWNVPAVNLRFPSNAPTPPGHHWANAVTMATPIAHKRATAGARVVARSALRLFLEPQLVEAAWRCFREEQTAEEEYEPFIGEDDPPPTHLNEDIMRRFRPELERFYYDETRYDSYLEQLGIEHPTLPAAERVGDAGR